MVAGRRKTRLCPAERPAWVSCTPATRAEEKMVGYPPQSRAGQPRADFGEDTSYPLRPARAAGIRARNRARILVTSFSSLVVGCGRFLA